MPTTLTEVLPRAEPKLYQLAYLWSGDRTRAHELVLQTVVRVAAEPTELARVLAAPDPAEALFHALAVQLEGRKRGRLTLRQLDDLLRTELTDPSEVPTEQRREHEAMLWELKRTCLTAVLGAIPAQRRLGFILTYVFGYTVAKIAAVLEVSESSVAVRNLRARAALRDHLGSRCRHVDVRNPCYCRGRLVAARVAGFVRPPPHRADVPDKPCDKGPVFDDPGDLYRNLPPIVPTGDQRAELDHVVAAADLGRCGATEP